jgi:arylsulfatase A-like enzyme
MSQLTRQLNLGLLAAILVVVCIRPVAAAGPPNVIVILVDDLGYGDISAYGCPDFRTPNIDSLATDGVRCLNGYTLCPICSPSRTGLMLGAYPQRYGIYSNRDRGQPIPIDVPTLAEFMRDAKYVTGMVGRWDIGDARQGPLHRGFLEVARRQPLKPGEEPPHYLGDDGAYATELHAQELIDFVDRHQDRPFFLYFSPLAVHAPVEEVPQKYLARVSPDVLAPRRYLAATLIALDVVVGRLLTKLHDSNLDERTLIFFTGDNGGWQPDSARNAPFRGGKATGWDGAVHEPFIVRWTGQLPAGTTYDGLVSTLDIYATAAAVSGQQELPGHLDGVNLIPYVRGEKKDSPHDALFWNWHVSNYSVQSVRSGPWRYMEEHDGEESRRRKHLADLTADPGETQNLIDRKPEVAASLKKRLEEWNLKLVPFMQNTDKPQLEAPNGRGWAGPSDASEPVRPSAGT